MRKPFFRAETAPAQFLHPLSLSIPHPSLSIPASPSETHIPTASSPRYAQHVRRGGGSNPLWATGFLRAQDLGWFLVQVEGWKEKGRSDERIAHGQIGGRGCFSVFFVSRGKWQRGEAGEAFFSLVPSLTCRTKAVDYGTRC